MGKRQVDMSRNDSDSSAKAIVYLIVLILMIPFLIWFYSAKEVGTGVVQSKWVETNTSCDDDGCTTSTSYMVQFDNGRIYSVFWGTRDWDRMVVGLRVGFTARGRDIRFFGWRIMQPTIFSVQIPAPPQ